MKADRNATRGEGRVLAMGDRLGAPEPGSSAAEGPDRLPPKVALVVTVAMSHVLMRGLLHHLRSQGWDVHFVSAAGPAQAAAAAEGAVVHTVRMTRQISPLTDLRALVQMYRLFRRERFALVHAGTPKGSLIGVLAAWMARVPVRVHTLHGLPVIEARGARKAALWLSDYVAIHLATHRLAVGQHVRNAALRAGLCAPHLLTVLGEGSFNGVDTTFFRRTGPACSATVRQRWGVGEDELVVGFVGRMVPDKGISELLEAMVTVWEVTPRARLVLAGPAEVEDPLPWPVEQVIQRDPRIHRVGPLDGREAVREAMEAFDVLALPSRREGLPNVLLEAASMEVPTVATADTGCADAVVDDDTGFLVPVRDSAALSTGLSRLLQDVQLRSRLAKNARDHAERLFAQQTVWDALTAHHRRALLESGWTLDAV